MADDGVADDEEDEVAAVVLRVAAVDEEAVSVLAGTLGEVGFAVGCCSETDNLGCSEDERVDA